MTTLELYLIMAQLDPNAKERKQEKRLKLKLPVIIIIINIRKSSRIPPNVSFRRVSPTANRNNRLWFSFIWNNWSYNDVLKNNIFFFPILLGRAYVSIVFNKNKFLISSHASFESSVPALPSSIVLFWFSSKGSAGKGLKVFSMMHGWYVCIPVWPHAAPSMHTSLVLFNNKITVL